MPILQSRGPRVGQCNICGVVAELSDDHTPPKGYARPVAMQVASIARSLSVAPELPVGKAPDGVKYRSICIPCNRDKLGSIYDPELISLARQVTSHLESGLVLPSVMLARVRPQLVMRSVLGHLAAQGVGRYQKGAETEALRDYLLDPDLPALPGIRFQYWLYPFRPRVVVRDAVIGRFAPNNPKSLLWLLKSFPLAFAVLWNRDFAYEGMRQPRDMDSYGGLGPNDYVDLPIDLARVPPQHYPEQSGEQTVLLIGKEAIVAMPSPPRGRLLRPAR